MKEKDTYFGRTYEFQNATFETSEICGITNVQTQFIPFITVKGKK